MTDRRGSGSRGHSNNQVPYLNPTGSLSDDQLDQGLTPPARANQEGNVEFRFYHPTSAQPFQSTLPTTLNPTTPASGGQLQVSGFEHYNPNDEHQAREAHRRERELRRDTLADGPENNNFLQYFNENNTSIGGPPPDRRRRAKKMLEIVLAGCLAAVVRASVASVPKLARRLCFGVEYHDHNGFTLQVKPDNEAAVDTVRVLDQYLNHLWSALYEREGFYAHYFSGIIRLRDLPESFSKDSYPYILHQKLLKLRQVPGFGPEIEHFIKDEEDLYLVFQNPLLRAHDTAELQEGASCGLYRLLSNGDFKARIRGNIVGVIDPNQSPASPP
ncbi:hypothetical protein T439DRAFT_222205 [Meredithblackwellia eburnea MCA 4105]